MGDGGGGGGGELEELPAPVGVERYREVLREEAGVEVGPLELAALAAEDAVRIEARMDVLAGRIRGGEASPGAWGEVFEELRRDHPEDAAAVLEAYRREVERARAFVAERGLLDPPEGPLEVVETPAIFPPGRYPLIAYLGYRLALTVESGEDLANHCRVCIPPLAVHETFPGHHAAFLIRRGAAADPVAGAPDRPGDATAGAGGSGSSDELRELSAAHFKNRFFHEGWGQYAELLMLESGYYAGEPERELGAWRNLLFRVERARVDALLHAGRISPEDAREVLADYLNRETAGDELRRHLAEPTFKAAYYVGALQVLELREAVRAAEPAFDLRDFHHRLVAWPFPVPEAAHLRFGVEIGPGLPAGGLPTFLAGQADPRREGTP
ncbi:MAG: DUF885 family protein [Thermoanaerobaculia bacterium]